MTKGLMHYDFQHGITNEKEDVIFTTKPTLFSFREKELCPLQPWNQSLDVLNEYIIDCSHRILLEILHGKVVVMY